MKKTLFALSLILSCTSWAQTINTDAPSMTPSAEVVSPRVFQYEGRMQYTSQFQSPSINFPSNLFRIGLSNRWEFRAINGLAASYSKFNNKWSGLGISGIQLGVKYAILANSERKVKMAVLAHYDLPTPTLYKYSSKYQSANIALALSHSLNDRSSISYSLGFNYSIRWWDPNQQDQWYVTTGTLAFTNTLLPRLNLFCEIYGSYASFYYNSYEISNDFNLNSDAGVYYQLRDNIQLDYTFGYGIVNEMYFHSIGFDIMIAPKKD